MNSLHPYAGEAYAAAFGPPYRPLFLPEWQTHLLLRPIGRGGREDATACYPRAVIAPNADLTAGLERLRAAGAVSVVLVLDPLVAPSPARLGAGFERARPFKRHFIIDRRQGAPSFTSHHRYEIRRAERRCEVREVRLSDRLAEWTSLYGDLIERHGITGVQRFSPDYFAALARLPGLVSYAAFIEDRLVAMSLWLRHDERACSHLAAANPEGYRSGASYLLYASAIAGLKDCRWLDLGGTSGSEDDAASGLARFKRGFANDTAEAWLCGHVLDTPAYAELSRGLPATDFFPAYRQPPAPISNPAEPADRSDTAPSSAAGPAR